MLSAAIGGLVALVVIGVARRFAEPLGAIDRPDGSLKPHSRAIPAVGGYGVLAGTAAGSWIGPSPSWSVWTAIGVLFVIGAIDDRVQLSPGLRLGAAATAGALAGWSVVGPIGPRWIWVLAGVAVVAVAVNAVNLVDGLDGLAGTLAFVTVAGYILVAGPVPPLPALAGAIVGFLIFNWPPARVFLGDGGAYVVGGLLAWFVLSLAASAGTWAEGLSSLVAGGSLFGVFVVDLAVTLVRRRRSGAPLFAGDRSHLYDQLRDGGRSDAGVVLSLALVQAVIVSTTSAAWLVGGPAWAAVAGVLLVAAAIAGAHAAGFTDPRPVG